jgi:hypothetical protein
MGATGAGGMSDERAKQAIRYIESAAATSDPDLYRAAQALIRKLEQELRETPGERERRARLEAARKAEQALAGPAAAYSRYLKKTGKAA